MEHWILTSEERPSAGLSASFALASGERGGARPTSWQDRVREAGGGARRGARRPNLAGQLRLIAPARPATGQPRGSVVAIGSPRSPHNPQLTSEVPIRPPGPWGYATTDPRVPAIGDHPAKPMGAPAAMGNGMRAVELRNNQQGVLSPHAGRRSCIRTSHRAGARTRSVQDGVGNAERAGGGGQGERQSKSPSICSQSCKRCPQRQGTS